VKRLRLGSFFWYVASFIFIAWMSINLCDPPRTGPVDGIIVFSLLFGFFFWINDAFKYVFVLVILAFTWEVYPWLLVIVAPLTYQWHVERQAQIDSDSESKLKHELDVRSQLADEFRRGL